MLLSTTGLAIFGSASWTLVAFPLPRAGQEQPVPATASMSAILESAIRAEFLWADYDRDGLEDALALSADGTTRLLRNNGDGSFVDVTRLAGLDRIGGARFAVWHDFDNDGATDLFIGAQSGPSLLLRNADDRTFQDVTEFVGLAMRAQPLAAKWLDYDRDGLSDLALSTNAGVELFHALPSGRFEAVDLGQLALLTQFAAMANADEDVDAVDGKRRMLAGRRAAFPALGAATGSPSVNPDAGSSSMLAACLDLIKNQATGACLRVSSTPTLGWLYPLTTDWNVSALGNVGIGTIVPGEKLDVAGVVRAQGGLRFGDGSLQLRAFNRQWSELLGVPPGFADGVDNDTLYSAGQGMSLVGGTFGFDTGFGDARYWNETQALGGDLSGEASNSVVARLQGRSVSSTAPSTSQVLKWNGSAWAPGTDLDTNTTYAAGAGLTLTGTSFSVSNSAIGAAQLSSDSAGLAKVSGGGTSMNSGTLGVNTTNSTGRVNIAHSSSGSSPHLQLLQQGASLFSRLMFSNAASPSNWVVAGGLTAGADGDRLNFFHSATGDVLSISGEGRVGVNNVNPLTALHVNGSLHLQGTGQDISIPPSETLQIGHFDGATFTPRLLIGQSGTTSLTGDVSVGGTLTTAPRARIRTYAAAQFYVLTGFQISPSGAGAPLSNAYLGFVPNADCRAYANINLPNGSVVTRFAVSLSDDQTSANVTASLLRKSFDADPGNGAPQAMASVASSGSSGGQLRTDTTISNAVIDTANFSYYAELATTAPTGLLAPGIYVYAVQIEYTTGDPLE